MAMVAILSSHVFGIMAVGFFTHINKFIQIGTIFKSFRKGPVAVFTAIVEFIVGLIELASEFSKVLSLSLRLFGNIFAGEVLITVISSLVAAFIPIPFMLLELMVGLIQATVFTMLTLVYLTVNSAQPHATEKH
jgi:F-type H+-transporting ATPase subunit a